jgi:signal transduction histidine kinase
MSISGLTDAQGREVGRVCVFEDVTKVREYETRMGHQERIATVGRIASEIAHEFNNQLGGVKGHLEFALKTTQSEPVRESLQVSVKALEKSLGLVRNLLNFSRRPEPKRAMCPLGGIVRDAVALLGADLASRKIEVVEQIDDSVMIMCDRMQMYQVLVNLMINARDAMPSGGDLAVTLSREGESVKVTVSDTGYGMPAENLEKVFEPFFTTKGGTDASGPAGTGLGLSVAKNIVEAHGGSIRIESKVGAGTMVVVRLPV